MKRLLDVTAGVGRQAVRLLQITDTHLFANKEDTLLSVNTFNSYQQVLDAIVAQSIDYDLIVATGDLVQDGTEQGYRYFCDGIQRLGNPCVWLPGNHDFQPVMSDIIGQSGLCEAKEVLCGDHWYVILLDSQVFGSPHGELSEYQLAWLDASLRKYQDRHTLVLLHHHPVDSGCAWLDQHRLRNSHEFLAVLKQHPQAELFLCGHIHQSLDLDWEGRRVLTSPSTCVQFKPYCTNFELDTLPPGWRYIDLHADGRVTTEVYRLETDEFIPDMDSDGY